MTYWTIPRLWPGEECFILGGGPSLTQMPLERLKGRRVIAVNKAFKIAPASVLFFTDKGWLERDIPAVSTWGGLVVTTRPEYLNRPGVKVVRYDNAFGISRTPAKLFRNKSSGGAAVNLAVHFGVKRIVLLGFDMRVVDGEPNFHREYWPKEEQKVAKYIAGKPKVLQGFAAAFPQIMRDLGKLGIEMVNATPGSALTCVPYVPVDEVLPPPVEAAA